ncbi:MAG TPA: nitrilase-related carbon-nitrogen hydrolase [Kofleriaceae bacterium]|nr:nitrilase-related carbon-nitrogen hydrolase [Kofleriaceae bacterium]
MATSEITAALIAVQLEIDREVLATADVYRRHVEESATRAVTAAAGHTADTRLIVFPEVAGHLALLALAPPRAHHAKTLATALAGAAVRRPLDVLRGVVTTRVLDPRHAMLAALAPDGERFWRAVMGPLARRHAAYVVAGSHLRLRSNGDITNASFLFAPDGKCVAVTDKINLVPGLEDGAPGALGLARGDAEQLPVVETPLGKLATLVCYDGFHTPHTTLERFVPLDEHLARANLAVVANPAANPWPWLGPWPPRTLEAAAHAYPTRAEQWEREGLPGTLGHGTPIARWGVTAHLVGKVLDLQFEGRSEILEARSDGVRVLARAEVHDRGGHVSATVRAKG